MSPAHVRVASWPHWYAPNRYIELFHRALSPRGIEHLPGLPLDTNELVRQGVHVVHLHWPEWAWQSKGRLQLRQRAGVRALERFIDEAGQKELAVIWTVHNLQSHQPSTAVEEAAFAFLHRRVNLRIFHSEEACAAAATRFGPGGETLVMPHGNYDGVFPSPRPPAETRAELGVPPGTNLLLMAGNLRAYKGIAAAAEASATTGVPIRLLAAGRAEGSDRRSLESLARSYAHLQVEFGRLSEQRVADLHGAADAVLLPYSQVSGSGALLTALTCARGVITSDRPYFREVLNPEPQAGTIARDGSIASLAVAIEEFLAGDAVQRASAARRLADRYSWDRVVPPVAKWLLSLTPNP